MASKSERQGWRALKVAESKLLGHLLSKSFPGRDKLFAQAQSALVSEIDSNGSLQFLVDGPLAIVFHRVPTEVFYFDGAGDPGGPAVHILLHVVEGRMHELEVYKDDGTEIAPLPLAVDIASLRFS